MKLKKFPPPPDVPTIPGVDKFTAILIAAMQWRQQTKAHAAAELNRLRQTTYGELAELRKRAMRKEKPRGQHRPKELFGRDPEA